MVINYFKLSWLKIGETECHHFFNVSVHSEFKNPFDSLQVLVKFDIIMLLI